MKKKILAIVLASLMLCISLSGCGDYIESFGSSSQEDDTEKYNAYIDFSNYITQWFDNALFDYFKEFGIEEDIIVRENFSDFNTYPILKVHEEQVEKTLEYASKEPSYEETDEAVKALCPKLKDFMDTIKEMEEYYQSKSFIDDDFKRGNELHKEILTQYEEYMELSEKFDAEFSEITEEKKQEDLEQLKEDDYMIRYYAMRVIIKAQDIQTSFYDAGVYGENILDFDVDVYREKYDSLTEDVSKFMEYLDDEERFKREGFENNAFISRFKEDAISVKAAATDIMQILETKNLDLESDTKGLVTTGETIPPTEYFDEKVSQLIDSYNNMIN